MCAGRAEAGGVLLVNEDADPPLEYESTDKGQQVVGAVDPARERYRKTGGKYGIGQGAEAGEGTVGNPEQVVLCAGFGKDQQQAECRQGKAGDEQRQGADAAPQQPGRYQPDHGVGDNHGGVHGGQVVSGLSTRIAIDLHQPGT